MGMCSDVTYLPADPLLDAVSHGIRYSRNTSCHRTIDPSAGKLRRSPRREIFPIIVLGRLYRPCRHDAARIGKCALLKLCKLVIIQGGAARYTDRDFKHRHAPKVTDKNTGVDANMPA